MTIHYRKDSPNGITPSNPDGIRDIVSHITKHRGMKTVYTSVSEDKNAIKHISGQLYKTDSSEIIRDKHRFITHPELTEYLKSIIQSSQKGEKVIASRAFQFAIRAKELLTGSSTWTEKTESIGVLIIYRNTSTGYEL